MNSRWVKHPTKGKRNQIDNECVPQRFFENCAVKSFVPVSYGFFVPTSRIHESPYTVAKTHKVP